MVKIGDIVTTDSDLMDAWHQQNDAGNGYAMSFEDVATAGEEELSDVVTIDPTGCIAGRDGNRIIVVCDSYGAWACDVTDLIG